MDTPEKISDLPQPEDYGIEVLCASWNPVVSAVVEPIQRACRDWIGEASPVDTEAFLHQFYRCQR